MATIRLENEYVIDAAPDRLWAVLGEQFLHVDTWVTGIVESTENPKVSSNPHGAPSGGRVCVIPGFGTTEETVEVFDPEARVLQYRAEAEEIPSFVTGLRNRWTLAPAGNGRTRVHQVLSADAGGFLGTMMKPVMSRKFAKQLEQVEADLRAFAESGRPSDAKRAELAAATR